MAASHVSSGYASASVFAKRLESDCHIEKSTHSENDDINVVQGGAATAAGTELPDLSAAIVARHPTKFQVASLAADLISGRHLAVAGLHELQVLRSAKLCLLGCPRLFYCYCPKELRGVLLPKLSC